MTAQGSPVTVLRRAIAGGDLKSVEIALVDVAIVDLQDALEIVLLMSRAGDGRSARWARRWIERAAEEERARFTTLMSQLPDARAETELRERAATMRGLRSSVRVHVPRA